ncbi:MAG: SDR family oxidoreductase [Planctomycetes bacterium]|nr:SDR family oxidoreductase [Planctomycetota bacterium]
MTDELFSVEGKRIAITGGAGVLGSEMVRGLAARGAKLAVLDIMDEAAEALCREVTDRGGRAAAVHCNVLDGQAVRRACDETLDALGGLDVLINAAGGNKRDATCVPPETFFDLPAEALRGVFELNVMGTILPSQAFGRAMAEAGSGVIVNISSMCALHPLTRVVGYSAAKAAVSNFTEWLATYMAQNHSKDIRVNAIAPGFFLTEQNRFLLTDEKTGELTDRGRQIIEGTPMGRFGRPEELIGTLVWLISDASRFVTGTVIPVDGGFNVYTI